MNYFQIPRLAPIDFKSTFGSHLLMLSVDPAPALGVDVTDPRTGVRGEGVTEIESSRKC